MKLYICYIHLLKILSYIGNLQVGYAEKIANVWAKVAEETSGYVKENS